MKVCYLILLLAIVSCGRPLVGKQYFSQSYIMSGQSVATNNIVARSTVAITFKDDPSIACSGTLISDDLVITAAHCVTSFKAHTHMFSKTTYAVELNNDIQVWFELNASVPDNKIIGQNLVSIVGIQLPKDIDFYESYNLFRQYDLALIKLAKKAPVGFIPVAILDSTYELQPYTEVLLAGFGKNGKTFLDDSLNKTSRPFERKINDKGFLVNQINGKEGVYHGDSGGPAYLESENALLLVGATSGGYDENTAYFVRVSAFKEFILSATKDMNAMTPVFKVPN